MPQLPRAYRITVYNRANEEIVGTYFANDPPRIGDLFSFFPEFAKDGDPFHHWGTWRIDSVLWRVSAAGSQNTLDLLRETDGAFVGVAFCWELEVLVWPEHGPYWSETPRWAEPLRSEADEAGGLDGD